MYPKFIPIPILKNDFGMHMASKTPIGVFLVTILKCDHLKVVDMFASDPFVTVSLPGRAKPYKTKTKYANLNPKWNDGEEKCEVVIFDLRQQVEIAVWDEGEINDSPMGKLLLTMENIHDDVGGRIERTFPLQDVESGNITLSFEYVPVVNHHAVHTDNDDTIIFDAPPKKCTNDLLRNEFSNSRNKIDSTLRRARAKVNAVNAFKAKGKQRGGGAPHDDNDNSESDGADTSGSPSEGMEDSFQRKLRRRMSKASEKAIESMAANIITTSLSTKKAIGVMMISFIRCRHLRATGGKTKQATTALLA